MSRRIAAFIRHADYQQLDDVPSALQPFGLSAKGMAQSQQAASDLADVIRKNQWQLTPTVYSSSLLRAWQTATIFCQYLANITADKLEVVSENRLVERSVGAAANLTTQHIEHIIASDPRYDPLPTNWKSKSDFKLPFLGAESLNEAGSRVADFLVETMNTIPIADDDSLTLFIGHGASFRHAACELGILSFEQIAALSMFHAQPLFFDVADNGIWHHISGEWKVRSNKTQFTD